jgi:hypothetical protein
VKLVAVLLFVGLSNSVFSQDTFSNQLKKILADTTNYFSSIKGEFKKIYNRFDDKDSVFFSKIDIVGFKETEYVKVGSFYIIQGLITDSVSKKKGKQILKEWKNRIRSVLGKSFTVKKDDSFKAADHSWVFKHDYVEISILLNRMLGEPNYPYFYVYFSIEAWSQADFLKTIKEDAKE